MELERRGSGETEAGGFRVFILKRPGNPSCPEPGSDSKEVGISAELRGPIQAGAARWGVRGGVGA